MRNGDEPGVTPHEPDREPAEHEPDRPRDEDRTSVRFGPIRSASAAPHEAHHDRDEGQREEDQRASGSRSARTPAP